MRRFLTCTAYSGMNMTTAKPDGTMDGTMVIIRWPLLTALDMLRNNKPMEEIVKYSHLPEAKILELAKQLHN